MLPSCATAWLLNGRHRVRAMLPVESIATERLRCSDLRLNP